MTGENGLPTKGDDQPIDGSPNVGRVSQNVATVRNGNDFPEIVEGRCALFGWRKCDFQFTTSGGWAQPRPTHHANLHNEQGKNVFCLVRQFPFCYPTLSLLTFSLLVLGRVYFPKV